MTRLLHPLGALGVFTIRFFGYAENKRVCPVQVEGPASDGSQGAGADSNRLQTG